MTAWATYYFGINLVTFCAFFIDKRKAIRGDWRTPERTLLILSAIGGAGGGWIAMQLFRHKTQHKKFTLTLPLLVILHAAVIYFCFLA